MEDALIDILARLSATDEDHIVTADLLKIIRKHNRGITDTKKHISKTCLLSFYLQVKEHDPKRLEKWGITPDLDARLIRTLQVKPRRTASGVATISVLTKPHACASSCLYCPNDVRMPKSYLADEPACQRAERACFDPYLQVARRLRTLACMGHTTDKVELIILGGTWSDYPESYRLWFVCELFRALNEADTQTGCQSEKQREKQYQDHGISNDVVKIQQRTAKMQESILRGETTYNHAVEKLYEADPSWQKAAMWQCATTAELTARQAINETAAHRVVGLVIETRPDALTPENLLSYREIGCTKIQIGIQSLDAQRLQMNRRNTTVKQIRDALKWMRLFGFKTHVHLMANLLGATPETDMRDYQLLVSDPAYHPDEVKLYPCALVEGTGLMAHYKDGSWQPYSKKTLIALLTDMLQVTPPFVRVSRMIRDISAHDIVAGNTSVNLRQMVEENCKTHGIHLQEIRSREIATKTLADCKKGTTQRISANCSNAVGKQSIEEKDPQNEEDSCLADSLVLDEIHYETNVSREYFLQWVTPDNSIAGFLRLSLPFRGAIRDLKKRCAAFPLQPDEAMIREVHIYGAVARIGSQSSAAQHRGLGKRLIERACAIARKNGYQAIQVISAVGTREYYRSLGFTDTTLYQRKAL